MLERSPETQVWWNAQTRAAGVQDVLVRMKDSVVGALKPDFFEKTTDNADLCVTHSL